MGREETVGGRTRLYDPALSSDALCFEHTAMGRSNGRGLAASRIAER